MNLNANPTAGQLRALLGRYDDLAGHHVLWVREDGEVQITCLRDAPAGALPTVERPDVRLKYDTFESGMEYVGEEAARDEWWTGELFADMVRRWPDAAAGTGITHVGLSSVAPHGQPVGPEEAARTRPGAGRGFGDAA